MSKDSRPLSPMDLALLAPDPAGAPRFLVFRSKFDAWRCSDVGPSLESAKRLAWDQNRLRVRPERGAARRQR